MPDDHTHPRPGRTPERTHRPPMLNPERYSGARRFLQITGPIVLLAGVVCLIVGFVSVIGSMNSAHHGHPRLLFLFFVGMPLLFVGIVMSKFGYARVVADYAASELSPVASGAVNYLGETTRDGVRAFGGALREGMHGEGTAARHCTQCGVRLASGARFCQGCGVAVAADE